MDWLERERSWFSPSRTIYFNPQRLFTSPGAVSWELSHHQNKIQAP